MGANEPSGEPAVLLARLSDRSIYLRQQAAKRLGEFELNDQQRAEALYGLKQLLDDPNKYVLLAAAVAIQRLAGVNEAGVNEAGVNEAGVDQAGVDQAGVDQAGVDQAAEALFDLMADPHRDIRVAAITAVGELMERGDSQLPPQTVREKLSDLAEQDAHPAVREAAGRALAACSDHDTPTSSP